MSGKGATARVSMPGETGGGFTIESKSSTSGSGGALWLENPADGSINGRRGGPNQLGVDSIEPPVAPVASLPESAPAQAPAVPETDQPKGPEAAPAQSPVVPEPAAGQVDAARIAADAAEVDAIVDNPPNNDTSDTETHVDPAEVPGRVRKAWKKEVARLAKKAQDNGVNINDEAVKVRLQDEAFKNIYARRVQRMEANPKYLAKIISSEEYKKAREVAMARARSRLGKGQADKDIDQQAVDRDTLMGYLQAKDTQRSESFHLLKETGRKIKKNWSEVLKFLLAIIIGSAEQQTKEATKAPQSGR